MTLLNQRKQKSRVFQQPAKANNTEGDLFLLAAVLAS